MLFGHNTSRGLLVGIDIAPSAIKLIALEKHNGQYQLSQFLSVPLPTEAMADQIIQRPELIINALIELQAKAKISAKQIVAAVPGSMTISKSIMLDIHKNWQQQEYAVWLQASQQFPELIQDIYFDYVRLTINKKKSNHYLLVASRKNVVDSRSSILTAAGFVPDIIDVDYYGLARAGCWLLQQKIEKAVIAFLHVDYGRVLLVVVKGEQVLFVREQNFTNCKNLAETAAKAQQLIQFYQNESQPEVEHWYLTGELTQHKQVFEIINQQINDQIELLNPLTDMHYAKHINKEVVANTGAEYMVACGLAMWSESQ